MSCSRLVFARSIPQALIRALTVMALCVSLVTAVESGWRATYSDVVDFAAPTTVQVDPTIDFAWGSTAPLVGMGADQFSVRWTGIVRPLYSELYTLHATSDDGIRVWVDGVLVINAWVNRPATTSVATIALVAGHAHAIRVDYYEHTGLATARLEWSSASQAREVIPATQVDAVAVAAVPPFTLAVGHLVNGTQLSWTAADGDQDAFVIQRSGSAGVFTTVGTVAGDSRTFHDGSVPVAGSLVTYRVRAQNAAGASPWVTVDGTLPAGSHGPGFLATYWNNKDYTGTWLQRIDPVIDFTWGTGSPAPALDPDTFAARWTGTVTVAQSGTYTLYATTDDGVRVWVDGALRIEAWYNRSAATSTGTVELTAGVPHELRMDYYENAGSAVARLEWSGPGLAREVIPASAVDAGPVLPVVPTQLVAAITSLPTAPVVLSWSYVDAAQSGFEIERSDAGSAFVPLATVSGSTRWFDDATAVPNTVMRYRVRAVNALGHGDWGFVDATIPPQVTTPGMLAVYWDNKDLTGEWISRIDPVIDFIWGAGGPSPHIAPDTFSARWTGTVLPPSAGAYTFYATTDDGVRVWVDEVLVIDRWVNRSAATTTATVTLGTGFHAIRMEYYENAGSAVARLEWSGPSVTRQPIPAFQWVSSVPPTIAQAAAASPNPVTGTTAVVTVLGDDDGGEPALTYTWQATGPAAVVFADNGTNAAKATTATFAGSGAYTLSVTVRDPGGLTVDSSVAVGVDATATTVVVLPSAVQVMAGATQLFTAEVSDQFNQAMAGASVTWATTGGGTIAATGVFTAASDGAGLHLIQATTGMALGVAEVTVNAGGTAPEITSPATAAGAVGQPFTYTITACNLPTAFTATGLPAGLSLATDTGVISGTPTAAGITVVTLEASNAFGTGTAAVTITVDRGIPVITWATPTPIPAGSALSATELAASANVPGTFTYLPALGVILPAGTHILATVFVPADLDQYQSIEAQVSLSVEALIPTVTWGNPAAIVYGTPLTVTQLAATASVSGTFTYLPGPGEILDAGDHPLVVTFSPTDTTLYAEVTAEVTLTVLPAVPVLVWADPAPIVYGTALSSAQLNASAAIPGTFTYDPPAGTVLPVGDHTLSATFFPADAGNMTTVTLERSLTVTAVVDGYQVHVSPETAAIPSGATLALTATVEDDQGVLVTGLPITWTTDGGSISPSGVLTAPLLRNATVTVQAEVQTSEGPVVGTAIITIDASLLELALEPAMATITEGDPNSGLTLRLLNGKAPMLQIGEDPIAVTVATSGTAVLGADYSLTSGPYSFAPGTDQRFIPLAIIDDVDVEATESITVTITAVNGGPSVPETGGQSQWTIIDNDADDLPVVSFSAAAYSVGEDGTGSLPTVTRSLSTGDSVIEWTVSGGTLTADDLTMTGVVTIPDGATSAVLPLGVIDDALLEGTETATVTLAVQANARSGPLMSVDIGVIDNEAPTTIGFSAPVSGVSEADATVQVTIAITPPVQRALPLTWSIDPSSTAIVNVDYTNPTPKTLTVAPGASTATITVALRQDEERDGDKTLVLAIATIPDGEILGQALHTVTIHDDEPGRPVFSPDGGAFAASVLPQVTITSTPPGNTVIYTLVPGEGIPPVPEIDAPGVLTYVAPILLSNTTTISACTVIAGQRSHVATRTFYVFPADGFVPVIPGGGVIDQGGGAHTGSSPVSPAPLEFVEGPAQLGALTVQRSTSGGPVIDMSGSVMTIAANRIAMNVPLSVQSSTQLSLTAPGLARQVMIDWSLTDLTGQSSSDDELVIRAGDALRYAVSGGGDAIRVIPFAGHAGVTVPSDSSVTHTYSEPGEYVVSGVRITAGVETTVGERTIVVVGAAFQGGEAIYAEVQHPRALQLAIAPAAHAASVVFASAEPDLLSVTSSGTSNDEIIGTVTVHRRGTPHLLVRVAPPTGGDANAGALILAKAVDEFEVVHDAEKGAVQWGNRNLSGIVVRPVLPGLAYRLTNPDASPVETAGAGPVPLGWVDELTIRFDDDANEDTALLPFWFATDDYRCEFRQRRIPADSGWDTIVCSAERTISGIIAGIYVPDSSFSDAASEPYNEWVESGIVNGDEREVWHYVNSCEMHLVLEKDGWYAWRDLTTIVLYHGEMLLGEYYQWPDPVTEIEGPYDPDSGELEPHYFGYDEFPEAAVSPWVSGGDIPGLYLHVTYGGCSLNDIFDVVPELRIGVAVGLFGRLSNDSQAADLGAALVTVDGSGRRTARYRHAQFRHSGATVATWSVPMVGYYARENLGNTLVTVRRDHGRVRVLRPNGTPLFTDAADLEALVALEDLSGSWTLEYDTDDVVVLTVDAPGSSIIEAELALLSAGIGPADGVSGTLPLAGGAANINPWSGNLHFAETIVSFQTPVPGPSVGVAYNSQDGLTTALGRGWRHSYDLHLYGNPQNGPVLVTGQGERVGFGWGADTPIGAKATQTATRWGGAILHSRHEVDEDILPADLAAGEHYRLLPWDGNRYYFDQKGRLTRIVNLRGQTLTLAYGSGPFAESVSDGVGRQVALDRLALSADTGSGAAGLTALNRGESRQWSFGYDGNHLLNTITLHDGVGGTFTHGASTLVWNITHTDAQATSVVAPGVAAEQVPTTPGGVAADAQAQAFGYDPISYNARFATTTTVAHTAGGTESWTFAGSDAWTAYVDPAGITTTRTLITQGGDGPVDARHVRSILLAGIERERFAYDAKGNLSSHRSFNAPSPDRLQTWVYEDLGLLGANLLVTHTDHGVTGIINEAAPVDLVTTYAYAVDAARAGLLLSIIDPNDQVPAPSIPQPTQRFTYTTAGFLATEVDALDHETIYGGHDVFGNPTTVNSPEKRASTVTYLSTTTAPVPPTCLTVTAAETAGYNGLVHTSTDAWDITTTTTYDRLLRPIVEAMSGAAPEQRVRSRTTTYDPMDRVTRSEDAELRAVTYQYDAAGRLVLVDAPGDLPDTRTGYHREAGGTWLVTTYVGTEMQTQQRHDVAGRLASAITWRQRVETAPGVVATQPTACLTTPSYDPQTGWMVSLADAMNRSTQFTHDQAGRVIATLPAGNGTDETWRQSYNEAGWILGTTSPDEETTTVRYDRVGRIRTQTNPAGGTSEQVYDRKGQLVSAIPVLGRPSTFGYDGDGMQVQATSALDRTQRMRIDPVARTITSWDEDLPELMRTQRVDALGDVVSSVTPFGESTAGYAPDGTVVTTQAPNRLPSVAVREPDTGRITSTHIDDNGTPRFASHVEMDPDTGRVAQSLTPSGLLGAPSFDETTGDYLGSQNNLAADTDATELSLQHEILAVDASGAALRWRDASQRHVRIDYDGQGRERVRYVGLDPARPSTVSFRTETSYTPGGRLHVVTRKATGEADQSLTYAYHALGGVEAVTRRIGSEAPETVYSAIWSAAGELLSEKGFHESLVRTLDPLTRQVVREVRQGNQVTVWEYDGLRRHYRTRSGIASTEASIAALPVVWQGQFDYVSRVEVSLTPLGSEQRTWNAIGELATRIGVDGTVWAQVIDTLGRLASETLTRPAQGSVAAQVETTTYAYAYPTAGTASINGATVPLGDGVEVTATTVRSDASTTVTTSVYDRGGRLRRRVVDGQEETWGYDARGDLVLVGPFQYVYEGSGRLASITDLRPGGTTAQYGYDSVGRTATVATGGILHGYGYDGFDRLTAVTRTVNGETETDTALRDGAGRLLRLTTSEGIRTWAYDLPGRLALERRVQGVDSSLRVMTYDARGNRTGLWQATPFAGSATSFDQTWTADGTNPPSELVAPAAPWTGVASGTRVTGGTEQSVALDLGTNLGPWARVRIQQVTGDLVSGDTRAAGLTLESASGMVSILVIVAGDGSQRLELRQGSAGSEVILGSSSLPVTTFPVDLVVVRQPDHRLFAQVEDAAGQVLHRVQATVVGLEPDLSLRASATGTATVDATFTGLRYDDIAALHAEQGAFDLANRVQQEVITEGGVEVQRREYTFTAAGNVAERRDYAAGSPVPQVTQYQWDIRHRLQQVTLPGGQTQSSGYLGTSYRRNVQTTSSGTQSFTWHGDHLIAQSGSGTAMGYLPGANGRPLAMIGGLGTPSPTTFAYAQDLLGDVVGTVTDALPGDPEAGASVYAQRFRYDAWGQVQERIRVLHDDNGTLVPSYQTAAQISAGPRYKGMWFDGSTTGLYKTQTRFYDPSSSRFLQPDPLGYAGSPNLYGWPSDPINMADRSGRDWEWIDPPGEWQEIPGTKSFPKPPAWVTPTLLGGDSHLNYLDNLFIFDAYQSASGSGIANPASRFAQTYANLQSMMRQFDQGSASGVHERALNFIGDSLYNLPEARPDTWAFRTADWARGKVAVAGTFYQEQSEQGNWIIGGLGATAETFASGAGDSLRVGEATGQVWAQGGNWKDWTIALSQDGGRGAGLALTFAPGAGALNAAAKAEAGAVNRIRAAMSTAANGGFSSAGTSAARIQDELADAISGFTRTGDEVAAAIRAGDIKISSLGDELFEKAVRLRDPTITEKALKQTRALQYGEKVYLRRSSQFLDADLIHEGKHVLDWFKGGLRYNSTYISEVRAYYAQRAFQLAKYGKSEFAGMWSIIKHVAGNY